MAVQYEDGMAVYIRDGVPVDPWGRTVEGYDDLESDLEEAEKAGQAREADAYDSMTADELKDELKARQEAGREIDVTGVRRKAELAQKLREDDAAQAAQA